MYIRRVIEIPPPPGREEKRRGREKEGEREVCIYR
jgi:hypothetical protein